MKYLMINLLFTGVETNDSPSLGVADDDDDGSTKRRRRTTSGCPQCVDYLVRMIGRLE